MPRLWLPVLTTLSLLVLFGAVTTALYAVSAAGGRSVDVRAPALPAPLERPGPAAGRCAHCGWIEQKRKILPGSSDPRARPSYEYTVRMADGSSRIFRQGPPGSWRLGEPLNYIDGADPVAEPVAASTQQN